MNPSTHFPSAELCVLYSFKLQGLGKCLRIIRVSYKAYEIRVESCDCVSKHLFKDEHRLQEAFTYVVLSAGRLSIVLMLWFIKYSLKYQLVSQ